MQRLSQMVLDMQARMTDMSSNLRLDFQEDASKMVLTLLNNLRQPDSARGSETQTIELPDFFDHDTSSMDEVMHKISQVTDDLESKTNTLNELLGRVSDHDGQIHLLMEAARKAQSTPPPAPPASDADLRVYVDERIRALREELMEGMDVKMADLKNSCDYKITSVQEQCEGQEVNYLSLAELMESKESDLRNEIQDLKTKLADPGKEGARLGDPVLTRVEKLESHLNSSGSGVETKCLYEVEKMKKEQADTAEALRRTVEDTLTIMEDRLNTLWVDTKAETQPGNQDVDSLKGSVQTLENRLSILDQKCKEGVSAVQNLQQDFQSCKTAVETLETSVKAKRTGLRDIEEQLVNHTAHTRSLHGELSSLQGSVRRLEDVLSDVINRGSRPLPSLNSTWSLAKTGAEQEAEELLKLHRSQHGELRQRLDELDREVKADADRCRERTDDAGKAMARLDQRVVSVERLCVKLDPISSSLQRIKEGLNKHVTGLWTCVNQLNGTVTTHARDIRRLQGSCQSLQSSGANIARDVQLPANVSPGSTGKMQENMTS